MKKRKLIIIFCIILIILPILLYSQIYSQKTGASDSDFEIRKGVLVSYNGSSAEITIPDTVSRIANGVFQGNKELIKVTIPGTVTSIDRDAFFGCENLK